MYENRIESLVESNRSKMVRIEELLAERDLLLGQIEDVHKINRSLAAAIDMYNDASAQPENGDPQQAQMQAQISKLQSEVDLLRARVKRLNHENFQLRTTNKTE